MHPCICNAYASCNALTDATNVRTHELTKTKWFMSSENFLYVTRARENDWI